MTTTTGPNAKRAHTALLLWGLALLSTLTAGASYWVQRSVSGEAIVTGKVLPGFSDDMPQVRTITIQTGAGAYNLVRKGNDWVMPERSDYIVSPSALSGLAKALADLSFKAARTSDPAQFARLGVDDPTARRVGGEQSGAQITMKNATGQILNSLYVGQKGDAVFVRKAGSNDVFEAEGQMPPLANLTAWLDLKVLDIMPETIASVSGGRTGQARYDIVRRPDGGFAPVGGVANVTATTAAIALTTWAPIDVIAASSLSSDPIASHVTTLRSGVTINATAYQERGGNWIVLSADSSDPTSQAQAAKINQRTDGWAFALSQTEFENFTFNTPAIVDGPQGNQ